MQMTMFRVVVFDQASEALDAMRTNEPTKNDGSSRDKLAFL